MAITSLSLIMWGSKFLASLISEEESTSPSAFLSSLVVRSFRHVNVVSARHLVNLMAGTTLQRRDCILKSVDPRITKQEKVCLRSASFLSDRLFDSQAKTVFAQLEDFAQDFSLQKSIKAMTAATLQLTDSTPFCQQKPPFQGAGTQGVPKSRKPASSLQGLALRPNNNPLRSPDKGPPPQRGTKIPSPPTGKPVLLGGTFQRRLLKVTICPPIPSAPYLQVGGRLQEFHQAWLARGASPWIVSILREGYHLEFENPPPLSRLAPVVASSLDPRKMETLQEQFDALFQKGLWSLFLQEPV